MTGGFDMARCGFRIAPDGGRMKPAQTQTAGGAGDTPTADMEEVAPMHHDDTANAVASQSPPTIDPVKAEDFIRRGKVLSNSGRLTVDQLDILYALDIEVQEAVTRAIAALGYPNATEAIPAIYWIAGNFPGVPADVIAAGIPGASLAKVQTYRFHALQNTAGLLYMDDADGLRSLPYAEYLETEHWKLVRHSALNRIGHACQVCKSRGDLHVHHNSYERRGEELESDVIVLCADCHALFHANRKVQP